MALAPDIIAGVARRLAEHAGLELPAWVVEARASARIAALRIAPDAYVELIASGRGTSELAALLETVRVGESSLFRHRPQIAALLDVVAPELRARGKRAIRVWSAGCASGEEPYTLAIVLARALPGCTVSIIATDVSSEALAVAEAATYPKHELEDVPDEWRDAFVLDGDVIRVRPELAQLVRFERANLVDATPPRSCDIVWCRNVLIYFGAEARRRVIDRLVGATVPGGYLFVGYSESLREITDVESRRAGDAVFYVRRSSEQLRTPPGGLPSLGAKGRNTPVLGVARIQDAPTLPTLAQHRRNTPARGVPAIASTARGTLVVEGTPDASSLSAAIGERLAAPGLVHLTLDLDGAVMLEDELAPVLRRARAAAGAAGVAIELRATRTGARRWLSRHGLEDEP